MTDTFHLRIKKDYAAAIIEDLIKLDAVEAIEEKDFDLTPAQIAALEKELNSIKNSHVYMKKGDDFEHKFKRT